MPRNPKTQGRPIGTTSYKSAIAAPHKPRLFEQRHYEKLAALLNHYYNGTSKQRNLAIVFGVELSTLFAEDSPKFSDKLFFEAVQKPKQK